jgi:hypothetical protein
VECGSSRAGRARDLATMRIHTHMVLDGLDACVYVLYVVGDVGMYVCKHGVRMHMHMHVHLYVYMHAHAHIHVHMHICTVCTVCTCIFCMY